MKKMKQVRLDLNYSRAEVARRAGLNVTTLSQAESGRFVPYPAQLAKIALALGWKADPERLLDEVQND